MLLLLETLTLYQIYNIYLTTSVKTVDLLFLCCFILSVIIYSHFLKSLFSSMLLLLSDIFLFIGTSHFLSQSIVMILLSIVICQTFLILFMSIGIVIISSYSIYSLFFFHTFIFTGIIDSYFLAYLFFLCISLIGILYLYLLLLFIRLS